MITTENIRTYNDPYRILVKAEDFLYLLPHPALCTWISNYTITFPRKGMMSDQYAVIPHGSATLVLSWDGNSMKGNLFGPTTKPVSVGTEANLSKLLFIVEFQPAGYYAFSGMPQKELIDCVIPFAFVHPALHRLMTQQLETATDIYNLTTEMDRLFLAHLKTALYQPEFSLANQLIIQSGGQASVKELAQEVFYSERHLGRIFEKYLGVKAKSFSRLVRINKSIHLLRHPQCSITRVSLETGFYDVSHFIHDFQLVCGITPQDYQKKMSDFYSEIAKF